MSEDNVEIVRRVFEALRESDVGAFVRYFHPDAEMLLPRNVLEGGSYRGHDGVRQAIADALETWEAFRIEISEIRTVGDQAVALGRTVNVGKGDAPTVEYESAYLIKLRDGKIAFWRPYQSHREALQVAGLRE
jgi:ketosteroid isomerase-like protein